MDLFNRASENIRRMWGNLTPTQRVLLSAAAVAMVALLFWGSTSSTGESWVRVAGSELGASELKDIADKLRADNVQHVVEGGEIKVRRIDADRIVLDLAAEGKMSDKAIWKFLDNESIVASKWDKEMRFRIALQNKLQAMIRSVDGIKGASVVLNPGSMSSQLGFAGPKPSASVQVDAREGLDKKKVYAIAGLVAKAVPGVEIDQVHIMDSKGTPYRAESPTSQMGIVQGIRDHERGIEEDIQSRIKSFLRSAMVVVRVVTQNATSHTVENLRDKPRAVDEEESKEVRKSGAASDSVGIKGEERVLQAPVVGQKTDEQITTGRTKSVIGIDKRTEMHTPAGAIQKISVGVLIPVETGVDGKEVQEAEKELPKYKEWIMKAAGPDADAALVSVQLIPSKRPEIAPVPPLMERALEFASAHGTKFVLVAFAFLGFVFILRVIKGAMPKDTVEELQSLTAAITESMEAQQGSAGGAGGGGGGMDLAIPGESDVSRAKQGIKDMIGKSPQNVAQSLKGFMTGK